MKFKVYPFLFLIAAFTVTSCSKNPNPKPVPNPTSKSDTDIYISGSMLSANGQSVATYWKNGVAVKLSDSSLNSLARSIAVRPNGDIYVVGNLGEPSPI